MRTKQIEQDIHRFQEALSKADAVLIGAGAGLSTSAGFAYDGERFQRYFADVEARYGFHDMYTGGFFPFPTLEEQWAYWSRFIYVNRYCDPPKPVYSDLLRSVKDKDYFVLTTNVDHCFQRAGFISAASSTPRAIMACGSAPRLVTIRLMITRKSSVRWWKPRAFAQRRKG